MYCIYCDAETPDTATFCPKCGRQFPRVLTTPAITCSSCRAANPNDAIFCWHCGRRLERNKAAGLALPELLLGGAMGVGAAEGISSLSHHAATDVGQGLGRSVTNAGQGLGHGVTDAGQGLGHAATDAGHGLGQQATNMGQGIGHAPGSMPPTSFAPSAPQPPVNPPPTPVPAPHPGPSAPVGHPGSPITPPQPTPPTSPIPPSGPAPHPMPPGQPGPTPPLYQPRPPQPRPVHSGEPEKGEHHEHHHHGSRPLKHTGTSHAPHVPAAASKLVLGLAPKTLLILVIGVVVVVGAIGGVFAITRPHTPVTGGAPGTSGPPATVAVGGTQSTPGATSTRIASRNGQMNLTFSGAKNGQVQPTAGSMVICGQPSPFLDHSSDVYSVNYGGTLNGVGYLILVGSPSASPGTYTPGSAYASIGEFDPHIGADGTSDLWGATGTGTITINNNGGSVSGSFDVTLTGKPDGTVPAPAPLRIVGSYVCQS